MVYIFQLGSGRACRFSVGSKLRHWPPGTNSKTFVPFFFVPRNAWVVDLFGLVGSSVFVLNLSAIRLE